MQKMSSDMSLGEFLRSRRERLTPEEAGIVSYGRRRTPGLRREEVAQIAHIGVSWYSSLEQGREVQPSEDVLNHIARALQLTESECRHLHLLAKPVPFEKTEEEQIEIGLVRMIQSLEPNPAVILGRSWDILLWNKAAELVFELPSYTNPRNEKINWIKHLLIDSKLKLNTTDWDEKMQVLIARFRADYGYFPNDHKFKELIEELMRKNLLFRETWPKHDVQVMTNCHKEWYTPVIGHMDFEHVTLQPPNHPDWKIMIYTASADTAIRLQQMMSTKQYG